MSLWRQMTHGLKVLTRRDAADQQLTDEVRDYFDRAIAEMEARGLSPADARRTARLDLGSMVGVRETVRSHGWEYAFDTLFADVRYGARRLRSAPAFMAVTVLTLAIAVGATTAIFSAVKPILFEPLPYPGASRLIKVLELAEDGSRGGGGTFAMFREFQEHARGVETTAVFRTWQPTVTGSDRPERLDGQRVSADYFRVLGVAPIAGRDFEPSDDRLHGPHVVILSDIFWRRRFSADPAIVGKQMTLDGSLYTVVGVMPARFENVLAPSASLWTPLQYDATLPADGREWGHHLQTIGRLRVGTSVEAATRELDAIGRAMVSRRKPPTYAPGTRFAAASLHAEVTRGVRSALLAITVAVVLVLVIACVNVTNLLLARGVQRRGEFALRAALGAGCGRLVRQLVTESVLIAAAGGAAGVIVAIGGVRALVALSPQGLPRAEAIRADASVFLFSAVMTALVGVVVGLIPARHAAREDPHGDLQRRSVRTTHRIRRTRAALVVAEVALAVILLVSSGLLLRSMEQLFAVPVGFNATGLVTMQVQAVGPHFIAKGATARFFTQAVDAVRRTPGVLDAAFTSQLPLSGDRDEYGAHFEATASQPADTHAVFRYAVTPQLIETMGIPLRVGRVFDEHDTADAPLVALVSESLAHSHFRERSAVGQRLRIGPAGPFTIVGVVGDVRQLSLALSDSEAVYIPAAQSWYPDNPMSLVVRGRGDSAALAALVGNAIWSVDKDQPVVRVATMDHLVAASAAERRFALVLFEAFALAALILAAAGIYGVLAGNVAEHTREIGVRAALGAPRADLLTLVLRQGMTITALGILIGVAGAVAATRALAAMLFGVSPLDPVTYLGVIALLTGVSVVACGVPATRATRVDPVTALRAE